MLETVYLVMKHGCTVMTPKLSSSHHRGTHHHHQNPRKNGRFSVRQRWCLSLFWSRKYFASWICCTKADCKQLFSLQVLWYLCDAVLCKQPRNGNQVHGRFNMTMHWYTRPNLCSSFSQEPHSTGVSTPIFPRHGPMCPCILSLN
jgi:hypothetical protein